MKTALILIVAGLVGASAANATTINLGFFAVSPQGNFLYNSAGDNCSASYAVAGCNMNPTVINLSPYVGDTITITDVGGLCVYSGVNCQVYPASAAYLGGIFSASGNVLAASNLNRVPDSVNAALPDIFNNSNLNSSVGNVNTTIPNDFYLPTSVVVVAPYLIVGTLDSAFADNSLGTLSSPGYVGDFGVDISVTTPEPSTAALLLTGVGGLWFSRRKFAKRA
jgi:hypothetical protein